MSKQIRFSPDDEEFFGSVGSFGVPKFDNAMNGGVPRGFLVVGFTETGSGSELFAKQLTSPAEEPDNTIVISTKVGGVKDYLKNSNSILVKPFNINQICKALIEISKNQKHLVNKKTNGMILVKKKLTNNIMGENYFNFLIYWIGLSTEFFL